MDELSTLGCTLVAEITEDEGLQTYTLRPQDLGLACGDEHALLHSGRMDEEAVGLLRILEGREAGARREIVCLNAAPLLYMAGKAGDLKEGVEKAADIMDSGLPAKKLREWVACQNSDPGPRLERLEKMLAEA